MAFHYECQYRPYPSCDRGEGRKPRKRCAYCKSPIVEREGSYVVYVWREDGRYRVEDALGVFETRRKAERFRDGYSHDNLIGGVIVNFVDGVLAVEGAATA